MKSSLSIDDSDDSKDLTKSGESVGWTIDEPPISSTRGSTVSETDAKAIAIQNRAYHLPGNVTWCEDWMQYWTNSHPLFSSCSQYKRSLFIRFVPAIASLLLGFAATNAVLLWNLQDEALSKPLFSASSAGHASVDQQPISFRNGASIYITVGTLYLWTWVAFLHALHDLFIWYIPSCKGPTSSMLWVCVLSGIAVVICAMFLSWGGLEAEFGALDMAILFGVEVFVSWFLWFPLAASAMFSGLLGCLGVPICRGRAGEMASMSNVGNRTPVNTLSALEDYDA
jgi:hypothetical protein